MEEILKRVKETDEFSINFDAENLQHFENDEEDSENEEKDSENDDLENEFEDEITNFIENDFEGFLKTEKLLEKENFEEDEYNGKQNFTKTNNDNLNDASNSKCKEFIVKNSKKNVHFNEKNNVDKSEKSENGYIENCEYGLEDNCENGLEDNFENGLEDYCEKGLEDNCENGLEFEDESELDSDENDEDFTKRFEGVNLEDSEQVWSLLSNVEREQFIELVSTGTIAEIVPNSEPWWHAQQTELEKFNQESKKGRLNQDCINDRLNQNSEKGRLNRCSENSRLNHDSKNGRLNQDSENDILNEDSKNGQLNQDSKNGRSNKHYKSFPKILKSVPWSQIMKTSPSPCVPYNILNILSAYAWCVRIFDNDHRSCPLDSAEALFILSPTLSANTNFESAVIAVNTPRIEALNYPWLNEGQEFNNQVLKDVKAILEGPKCEHSESSKCEHSQSSRCEHDRLLYVAAALSDVHSLFSDACEVLRRKVMDKHEDEGSFSLVFKSEKVVNRKFVEKKLIKISMKKIEFFLSYLKEFPDRICF